MNCYILDKLEIEEIKRITGIELDRPDNKVKKKELDLVIQRLTSKIQELIEEKRHLLGWKNSKVDDMYFNYNGLVFSQLTYSYIISDLINEYENITDTIDEIKTKQREDGYVLNDPYDEVIEREILEG